MASRKSLRAPEVLAAEVRAMIDAGTFRPGERVPSTRHMAATRKVSAATVMQAYETLVEQGVLAARPRAGYFVAGRVAIAAPKSARIARAVATDAVPVSELVFDVMERIRAREVIPFASAFPSPALFPLPQLARDLARATRRMDPWKTVEDLSPGSLGLRQQVAKRYALRGMRVAPDEIVITAGALEALNLCLAAVTRPGDAVALESPVFYGALQATARLGLRAVEVATDPETGVDLAALERAIREQGVKACWLMPNLQNPLGATMPEERRRMLARLLAKHEVALVEDDVYSELRFDAPMLPAKAFDDAGLVLHCSSFSKSLAPGYRVGWCVPGRFRRDVERAKLTTSIATSVPAQEGIAEYLRQGGYERHLRGLRATFEANQRAALVLIAKHFPEGTRATAAQGGYFTWIALPAGFDAMALHARALREGISVAPGPMFSTTSRHASALRLNFGHRWDAQAGAALARLGSLAHKAAPHR